VTPEEKLIVERLKATYVDVDEMEKVFDIVTKTLALREAELSVAKALLARAADALEYWNELPESRAKFLTLIAELRKAAE
jgi:hypothetical protein